MTSLSDRLRAGLTAYRSESPYPPADTSLSTRRERRRLSEDDVTGFMAAADSRENPLWGEIEVLLVQLQVRYPLRAKRLRKEIKWLRRQAYFHKLQWGRK